MYIVKEYGLNLMCVLENKTHCFTHTMLKLYYEAVSLNKTQNSKPVSTLGVRKGNGEIS